MNEQKLINEEFYAPRARFDRIYVLSPIKIACIFLSCHHCLFLLLSTLNAFWIETNAGYYGPLFRCERDNLQFDRLTNLMTNECSFGGFSDDSTIFRIPSTAFWILISLFLGATSIILALTSFIQRIDRRRFRFWFSHVCLLLVSFIIEFCVLISLLYAHRKENYRFQWAFGVFFGGTIFNFVSFLMGFLTVHSDDVQYIERVEQQPLNH